MLSMYIASRRAQSSQPIGSLAPHEDYVLGTNSGRIDEDETFGWGRGGDVFCFKPLNGHHVLQVLIHPHKTQLSLSIPPPSSPWMMTVYSPKKWNQPLENGYHRIQQTYRETNISREGSGTPEVWKLGGEEQAPPARFVSMCAWT